MIFFISVLLGTFSAFDSFDDSIHFDVVWGDPINDFSSDKTQVKMMTANNEEYVCQLPKPVEREVPAVGSTTSSAREIIGHLEGGKVCSYRVDSYWIYEVCHGSYVKQFHEERDPKDRKILLKQQYFLGNITTSSYPEINEVEGNIPTINHAGALRPYYSVKFTEGTACDLIPGTKRETTVFYLCMPDFQTSIVSVKESSTCAYEVIVYTSLLCSNKLYRVREDPINHIYCLSQDGRKWVKPVAYDEIQNKRSKTLFDSYTAPHLTSKVESNPKQTRNNAGKEPKKSEWPVGISFVTFFLSGQQCADGGTGWWKYEFCYKKSIKQYHVDKKKGRREILLGLWDEKMHIDHVREKNLIEQKRSSVLYTDLYFFNGEICDQTGLPRRVQVRLRCSMRSGTQMQMLTMYLEEPAVCEYRFTVESALFCMVLAEVDEFGIPITSLQQIIQMMNEEEERYKEKQRRMVEERQEREARQAAAADGN